MNRAIINGAVIAAMAVAMTMQAESALACELFGGGGTGARGAGDKGDQLMSDGANVAWFEWSDAEGGFVQVQRWFDPYASQMPIQPDEVDATDWLQSQGLLSGESGLACGGLGGSGSPVMPVVTVRPGPTFPFQSGGFLGRIMPGGGGGGTGRIILQRITLTYPFDIPVEGDCSADRADYEACQSIKGAIGTAALVFTSWNFTAVFQDGRRTDYTANHLYATDCAIVVRANGRLCE